MTDSAPIPAGRSGHLFVVSAPSGAGKTTLCTALMQRFPDIRYSVSATTRPARPGEIHGKDYFFLSQEAFEQKIRVDHWAEWARVHGHYYGTSARAIDTALAQGRDLLLDIDVQGTRQILKRYPDAVTIFIMPPSTDVLRRRLLKRNTDSAAVIDRRLAVAEAEMAQRAIYRHILVNDVLADAIEGLTRIVARYRDAENSDSKEPAVNGT